MRKITVEPCSKIIELGRYGENEATAVYLPLAEFQNYTPGGAFSVLVRRPDVTEPSPVSFTSEGGYAIWVVGEDQLAVEGYGEVELRYVIGETRALSRVWSTHIGKSLLPVGDTPPDPFESWYENIIEASEEAQEAAGNASLSESAAAESERQAGLSKDAAAQSARNAGQSELAAQRYAEDAEEAKEAIEDMTVSSETLEAGSQATVEKSIVEGVVNLKFGIPKGKDAENVISRDTQTDFNGILRGNGTTVDIQAVDNTPTENSNNLVSSDGVAKALQGKQDTLTFDSEPTSGSTNPVTSDGVFNSIVKVLPTATASGSTASFDDGADGVPVKSLEANIEPVQDLHGYDAPWPAGGGKNLLDYDDSSTFEVYHCTASISNYVVTLASTGVDVNFGSYNSSVLSTVFGLSPCVAGETCKVIVSDSRFNKNYVTFYNASGTKVGGQRVDLNSFTIPSGATQMGFRIGYEASTSGATYRLTVMVVKSTETDATFAPYSNICPISGWTGANISATGVNVWDEEWEVGNISDQTGENIPQSNIIRSKNYIPVKANTTYYSTMQAGGIFFYDANKQFIPTPIYPGFPKAFTTPANCYYIRFREAGAYGTTYNHDISINYPATDTEYHPYQGTIYSIAFPSEAGTVYGGTLDVTNGVLTVDRVKATRLWGDFQYQTVIGAMARREFTLPSVAVYPPTTGKPQLCSIAPYKAAYFEDSVHFYINGSSTTQLIIFLPVGTSDGTEFEVSYELATPIVYHLTPTEVTTLLAQNNIWADTGDITVTYRQDVGLAINKLNNAILSLGGNI